MCEEFGMDYLEIQAEHPFTRHDLDSRRIGDVADALSSHQLKVTVHGPLHDMNLSSLKDGIREASVKFTRECIEMTNYLGGSILVIHGGTCPEDEVSTMLERSRKALQKSLKELSWYAGQFGVRIAIENKQVGTDRELVLYPEEHAALVSHLEEYDVGAVLDVGHANTTNRDLAQHALMLGAHLTEIHLHDNMVTHDDHLPLGTGTVRFPELFSVLKQLDFQGP